MLQPLEIKSLTLLDSATSTSEGLQALTIKSSPILKALNVPTSAKTTYIPYAKIPLVTDTAFVVGGLEIVRTPQTVVAPITDETIEDAVCAVDTALADTLAMQARIDLENVIATKVKLDIAVTPLAGVEPTAVATVIGLLGEFDPMVFSIDNPIYVATSYGNYFQLLASTEVSNLVVAGVLVLTPMSSLLPADVVLLSAMGAKVSYEAYSVERERVAGSGSSNIVVSGTFGSAFASTYVKRATI